MSNLSLRLPSSRRDCPSWPSCYSLGSTPLCSSHPEQLHNSQCGSAHSPLAKTSSSPLLSLFRSSFPYLRLSTLNFLLVVDFRRLLEFSAKSQIHRSGYSAVCAVTPTAARLVGLFAAELRPLVLTPPLPSASLAILLRSGYSWTCFLVNPLKHSSTEHSESSTLSVCCIV